MIYYQDNSIKISRLNYTKEKNDMTPHDHDFLTVSLLLSGKLIENADMESKIVYPGNVLIKPPALRHGNLFLQDSMILSIKIYDIDYYKFNYENWMIIQQNSLLKYFLNVINSADIKNNLELLNDMIKICSKTEHCIKKVPKKMELVKQLIETNFLESISISKLANEFNIHPVHLGRSFKSCFGIDIKSYQHQLRIHYCLSNLILKKQNLTQLAYEAGYSDQSHFTREFKKSTDMTPKKITQILSGK
jgi:AraC-like DNA-binding protein